MRIFTVELYRLDLSLNAFSKLDEIITYENLRWTDKGNSIGGCIFNLNIHDPKANKENLLRYANHVCIKEYSEDTDFRGIVWFFGPITKISGGYQNNNGSLTVESNSYLYHFTARYTAAVREFTNTDQAEIMWTLIDESQSLTNGNLLVSQGTIVSGTPRDRHYEYGRISDLIMNISNVIDGNDFSFDPVTDSNGNVTGMQFNTYNPRGIIRNDLNRLQIGENVDFVSFSTRGDIFNDFIGIGAGSGEDIITSPQSNVGSQTSYTRREAIYANKDVSEQDTLDEQTLGELNKALTDRYDIQVSLMPEKDPVYGTYQIGDYLKLDIQKGFMSFDYWARVNEIQCSVDKEGVLKVTPILTII